MTESLSFRNQSNNLQSKSMNWFLYDRDLHYERLKQLGRKRKSNNVFVCFVLVVSQILFFLLSFFFNLFLFVNCFFLVVTFNWIILVTCFELYDSTLMQPGLGPCTWTLNNLDPEKPRPWKTWTPKNLDPEKREKQLDVEKWLKDHMI